MKTLVILIALACVSLSGCAEIGKAYAAYNQNVARDISIGADQQRGAYASYTAHLGPRAAAPDFKQPVDVMTGAALEKFLKREKSTEGLAK